MNQFQAAISPDLTAFAQRRGWSDTHLAVVLLAFVATRGLQDDALIHAAAIEGDPAHPVGADAGRLLAELVDQIDGLGIADWHGAESLSMEDARAWLAGRPVPSLEQARALAAVGRDEPDFSFQEWQDDVRNGDTRRGYADWVLANREQADDETEQPLPVPAASPPPDRLALGEGPWRVGGTRAGLGPQGVNDRYIRDAAGRIIASASEGSLEQARTIARRIVASVNACAGIDTAQLERFSLVDFRESALNVVRNGERGDLAGAVNILEGDAEAIGGSAADVDAGELEEVGA